jgi:hypothetical protein
MIKKISLGLLIVVSVVGILIGINIQMDKDCSALSAFQPNSIKDFFRALQLFGLLFLVLVIGFVIYFRLLRTKRINFSLYFMILSLIVSYPSIKGIYNNLVDKDRDIKARICEKSIDDGMLCTMKDLNYEEYLFVSKHSWLPPISDLSKNISIEYFRDDFIGDYNLIINIWIPENSKELEDKRDWNRTLELSNGYIKYEYQKGQS